MRGGAKDAADKTRDTANKARDNVTGELQLILATVHDCDTCAEQLPVSNCTALPPEA